MSARLEVQGNVVESGHAERVGGHDHFVRDLEARRRQAEAIVDSVHWTWTSLRRAMQRLAGRNLPERGPAANDNRAQGGVGAFGLGLWPVRRIGRSILDSYAKWRRRRIAIDELRTLDDRVLADIGLRRGQIELAVDGLLRRRGESWERPVGRDRAPNGCREDLPLAA
ncbi:MAG: DUF1127 domain-containing protein [Geminicoccaceae bacterium]|jgi:uncharacterized protein YjiS (DUF1127 family)|nr:DUF1127 domain-containing protein [Geminicoccaceae bacterium]HRY24001.1 DUF1127 domain-containing protein [Geminicoccaceae bacterium]